MALEKGRVEQEAAAATVETDQQWAKGHVHKFFTVLSLSS